MERLASNRYRWEDEFLDHKGKKHGSSPAAPAAEYLQARQRVAQLMDTTGWGTILVMMDATLSIFSVVLYIAMTYHPLDVLYHVDLILACLFAANWAFWLWVAEDRLRYIFGFLTAVDAVTIIPAFVLYGMGAIVNETVPGLNFLRVLRILRVLRVFRMKHIMRRHLEGAVMEAAGKLVFSLLSIMFIAAGLFYELEKYGPPSEKKTPDLQFHMALYWAAVTLTTVGYGDIVPTYWATQVMLIFLLMLTFTLLPYLTGQLMDALTSTSVYQRKRFTPSRRSDVSHVVITGFLDGGTVQGILDELYHEDKGFNNNYTVLLSERPPSHDVEHALATHSASKKISFLQGSPFRSEDWQRTAVEYASAVFIFAPKYPEDPTLADRYLSMCALSLGQYLQDVHVSLRGSLSYTPNRIMYWMNHGVIEPPAHLPSVYVQVCLPEGRLRLFQVLQSLQDRTASHNGFQAMHQQATAAAAAALQSKQPAADADAAAAVPDDDIALQADDAAAAGETDCITQDGLYSAALGSGTASAAKAPASASRIPAAAAAAAAAAGVAPGDAYTGRNCNGDATVDLSAFQSQLAAAQQRQQYQQQKQDGTGWSDWGSAKGSTPSPEPQHPPHAKHHPLPTGCKFWLQFSGSIHVLCLSEVKYAMMAQSVVGVPGAMTLLCNLSTTVDFGLDTTQKLEGLPPWLRDYMVGASQEIYQLVAFPSTLVGRSMKEAAGFIFDSCHAVLLALEPTQGLQRHRLIVADLEQVITPDMRGYIVADDMSSVLLISAAEEGDFELWHELRQQRFAKAASQHAPGFHSSQHVPADASATQLEKSSLSQGGSAHSSQQRRGGAAGGSGGLVKPPGKRGGQSESWRNQLMKSSSLLLHTEAPPRGKLAAMMPSRWSATGSQGSSLLGLGSTFSSPSKPMFLEPSQLAEQLHLQHQQEQQLPVSRQSVAGGGGDDTSSTIAAVAAGCGAVGVTRKIASGHASALGALIHLLRSPSRQLREQGEAFMREHYHMRGKGAVQWDQWIDPNMNVDLSHLSGHILILGVPASQDGLLSLLAALRSKRLLQWRPVVIIDSAEPRGGGSWEAVAQFSDVYFIQSAGGLNDALLRASAEHAAQAILMSPLVSHDYDNEDQRLASRVMTDAVVVNRYQLLRSINPSIELVVEMMLPQNVAYLSPTTPVPGVHHKYLHLLSPAYISGCVFHARLLDDLMTASYCNGASDRIVLQLLHRWHMGWAAAQAFSTLAKEQQEVMPDSQQLLDSQPEQQWMHCQQHYHELLQQQQQPQQQQQHQQQQGATAVSGSSRLQGSTAGQSSTSTDSAAVHQAVQQVQQDHWRVKRFKVAAMAVPNQLGAAAGEKVAPEAAAAIVARAVESHGVPTLMQIPVDCAPGTSYGRYFHSLLHTRGLLLLGVHRQVVQDGLSFRATITNPSYHSEMQTDDHAFVVARLHLPSDCSDRAAVAAAWPPDTLGFSNLDPPGPAQQHTDLWGTASSALAGAAPQDASPVSTGSASSAPAAAGPTLFNLSSEVLDAAAVEGSAAAERSPRPRQSSTHAHAHGSVTAGSAGPMRSRDSGYTSAEPFGVGSDEMAPAGAAGGFAGTMGQPQAGGAHGGVHHSHHSHHKSILIRTPAVQGAVMHVDAGKGAQY